MAWNKRLIELPWTQQPQHPVPPDARSPYWRDGSIVLVGGDGGLWSPTEHVAAMTGAPVTGVTTMGIGPVVASGVVPSITIPDFPLLTLLVALRPASVSSYGRVFSRSDTFVSMFGNISAGGIDFTVPHSGASGWWDINSGGFAAARDYVIGISYDGSNVAKNPIAAVNGAPVTVSRFTAPTGTRSSYAGTLVMGNRADGQRWMGGALALFALIPDVLDADALAELTANPWQLMEPTSIWVPGTAGGASINVTLIDAATASDVASASATRAAVLTDAAASIDLLSSTAGRATTLTDIASAVDVCSAAATLLAGLVEPAAGADALSAALTANASLLDAATAADLASAMATMAATLTDSATAVDLLTATRIANAAALEAAAAVDQVNSGSTVNAQVQEAASTTDALSAAATLVVQLVEAGTVLDQLHAAPDLVALLTEAAAGSDLASATVPQVYSVTALELAAALDLLAAVMGTGVTLAPGPRRVAMPSVQQLQRTVQMPAAAQLRRAVALYPA